MLQTNFPSWGIPLLILCLLHPLQAGAEESPEADPGLTALVGLLAEVDDPQFQLDLLKGMRDGLKGRKTVVMPPGWRQAYQRLAVSKDAEVRRRAKLLALTFGDQAALDELKATMSNPAAPREERLEALDALVERRVPGLAEPLQALLDDQALRAAALRGLGAYDHEETPERILRLYPALDEAEQQDAIATLAARPAYARRLLDAIQQGVIPRSDVSAFTARQLQDLGDKQITSRLRKVWGDVRTTSAEKRKLIAKYKALLTPKKLEDANLSQGRLVFSKTCQQCHKLFGEGAKIGPDLTGSNRDNLDYVLENAVDPSAVIGRDYRLTNIITDNGRVLSGIIVEESQSAITLQTVRESVVVSKADIDEMAPSSVSMMPDGQLEKLTTEQLRDLVAYLKSRQQVPLPPTEPAPKQPASKEAASRE